MSCGKKSWISFIISTPRTKKPFVVGGLLIAAIAMVGILLFSKRPAELQVPEETPAEAPLAATQEGDESNLALEYAEPAVEARHTGSRPFAFEIQTLHELSLPDEHEHTLGRWLGSFSVQPRRWPQNGEALEMALEMPDGTALPLVVEKAESYGPDKGLWAGSVTGREFSEVIVTYVRDATVGSIRLPDAGISWEIRNQGDGVLEFEKVDLSLLKGCAKCKRHEG